MDYKILKEQVIRIEKKKVYFFDSEGIYTETSVEEARRMHLKGLKMDYYKRGEYCSETDFSGPTARAILCLEVGDSIDKLEQDIARFEKAEKKSGRGYINVVLRKVKRNFYFFNEKEEWTCLPEKEILTTDISMPYIWFERGKDISYLSIDFSYKLLQMLNVENKVLLSKSIGRLEVGDSIEKLKEYCNGGVTLKKPSKACYGNGIVTRICEPEFVCNPENSKKTTTFDYINVDVNLLTTWKGDKKAYLEKHKKEISNMVLEKVKKDRTFLKYGLPINCLKIANIVLYKGGNMLQYVLELKSI